MNNLSELMNDFIEKKISMEEYISKIESFEINDDALFNDFLNGGVRSFIIPWGSSTNCFSTAFIQDSVLSLLATPLIIEKLCDIKSILHSVFSWLPSLSPLSKNALK